MNYQIISPNEEPSVPNETYSGRQNFVGRNFPDRKMKMNLMCKEKKRERKEIRRK